MVFCFFLISFIKPFLIFKSLRMYWERSFGPEYSSNIGIFPCSNISTSGIFADQRPCSNHNLKKYCLCWCQAYHFNDNRCRERYPLFKYYASKWVKRGTLSVWWHNGESKICGSNTFTLLYTKFLVWSPRLLVARYIILIWPYLGHFNQKFMAKFIYA